MRALKSMAWAFGLGAIVLCISGCPDDPAPADAGGLDATMMGNPDAPPNNPDATEIPDTGPGPMDAAPDAGVDPDTGVGDTGGGRLLFSDFVKGLINTQTNGTSEPTALPPEGTFIDTEDPAEYQILFP